MGGADPNRRRVALVTTELRHGGAERCLTELAIGLSSPTVSTEVISLAPLPTERDELVQRLREAEIPIRVLGVSASWQLVAARRRLRAALREVQPDYVLSFLFHANLLTAISRGRDAAYHHIANLRVADPRRWRLGLEKRWLKPPVQLVAVSQSVCDFYRQTPGFREREIKVIPNGVDVAAIDRQLAQPLEFEGQGSGEVGPVVGFVGRLDRQKGLDRWLRVWPEVVRQVAGVRMRVVGSGPEAEPLRELAGQLGIADSIDWLGWQAQPWRFLGDCQLMVFPSRWEGLSNALLEAVAAGKPVVATKVEGAEQVLGCGPDVQLLEGWDPGAWESHVVRLLNDSTLAQQCAVFNRSQAEGEFSLQAMIQRFEKLLGPEV